jgi:hypothetical protein
MRGPRRAGLREMASRDLATVMRELVWAMVDAHLVDPALHRIFAEQVPRMGQLAKIESLQRETFLLIRSYLEERRSEISVADLDSATSICVTTVESLTHEFVIHKPDALDGDRDRFIDEVTRLVVGYLRPGRAGPGRLIGCDGKPPGSSKRVDEPKQVAARRPRHHVSASGRREPGRQRRCYFFAFVREAAGAFFFFDFLL